MTTSSDKLYICWTTTSNQQEAERIATLVIEKQLAACAQIDGPIRSFYRWEGKVQTEAEFRITFKTLEPQLEALEKCVKTAHSYETPQWICLKANKVSEKYLKWTKEASSFSAFL